MTLWDSPEDLHLPLKQRMRTRELSLFKLICLFQCLLKIIPASLKISVILLEVPACRFLKMLYHILNLGSKDAYPFIIRIILMSKANV